MNKIDIRFFKYKLCLRFIAGESFKKLCNELVDYGILDESLRYKGQPFYNSFNVLYNFYISYKRNGIFSLIDSRGRKPSMPKKGSTKREWEEKRKKERKEILENLTKEQLLEVIEIQQEILNRKIPKKEIYKIIKEKKSNELKSIPIRELCKILDLSKSYFYILDSNISRIDKRYRKDKNKIKNLIKTIYFLNKTNYGARRIQAILQTKYNISISYKTVYRYMNELNLKATIRVRNKRRVDLKNTKVKVENILNRNFVNQKTNNSICTDVTYIKWNGLFLYLSAAIDLRNNEIVGWSISNKNDLELVMKTFSNVKLNEYSIIHSDHGYQYSSNLFKELLLNNNIIQSMSRIGNSLDNRPIEYWFSILKEECIKKKSINKMSIEQITDTINEFICYYNNDRIQLNLKNLSPCDYAKQVF